MSVRQIAGAAKCRMSQLRSYAPENRAVTSSVKLFIAIPVYKHSINFHSPRIIYPCFVNCLNTASTDGIIINDGFIEQC
jgi:hypothetical protein